MTAMAHCCRQLFIITNIVTSLGKAVGLPRGDTTMKVYVHYENTGDLVSAIIFLPQLNPCIMYYASKTIWFNEDIFKHAIKPLKIDTVEYLGDLFTKYMSRTTFEYMCKNIMGC